MKRHERCRIRGSSNAPVKHTALFLSFFHLLNEVEADRKVHVLDLTLVSGQEDPSPRHRQVGSLAGAANLSNDNPGVLR